MIASAHRQLAAATPSCSARGILAFQQLLHDEGRPVLGLPHVEDVNDVGMTDGRWRSCASRRKRMTISALSPFALRGSSLMATLRPSARFSAWYTSPSPAGTEERVQPVLAGQNLSVARAGGPCVIPNSAYPTFVRHAAFGAIRAQAQSWPCAQPRSPSSATAGRRRTMAALPSRASRRPTPRRLRDDRRTTRASGGCAERREFDGLLWVIEEERVVDDSATRLNVLGGVPRERPPRRGSRARTRATTMRSRRWRRGEKPSDERNPPLRGCSSRVEGCTASWSKAFPATLVREVNRLREEVDRRQAASSETVARTPQKASFDSAYSPRSPAEPPGGSVHGTTSPPCVGAPASTRADGYQSTNPRQRSTAPG